jgi:hypothetical protein
MTGYGLGSSNAIALHSRQYALPNRLCIRNDAVFLRHR